MSDSQTVDKGEVMEPSKSPGGMQSVNKKMTHVFRGSVKLDDHDLRFYRAKRTHVRGLRFKNMWKNYYGGVYQQQNNNAKTKILRRVLRSTKRLQEFSFGIDDAEDITDIGLNEISESIRRMTDLRKVHLDFEGCHEISDEALLNLGQALKCHSSLKSLALKFGKCEKIASGGQEGVEIILKSLTSLQHLELDFHDNYMQDFQIGLFGEFLKRLRTLKSIALDLSKLSGFEGRFLPRFFKKFPSLERISLKLTHCTRFNDTALENLSQTLQTLKSLQELCFDFGGCYKLSDTGINSLCEALKSLTSLKSITLVFSDPWREGSKITDAGLQSLGDTLKHLTSLRKISLDFSRLDITDAGLLSFGRILETCTSLESINLAFDECEKISSTAKDEFWVIWKTFPLQKQKDSNFSFWGI